MNNFSKKTIIIAAVIALLLPLTLLAKSPSKPKTPKKPKTTAAAMQLEPITITGKITAITGKTNLAVVSNGVTFNVSVRNAKFTDKSGKPMDLSGLKTNDEVRVEGRHVAQKTYIIASAVKKM